MVNEKTKAFNVFHMFIIILILNKKRPTPYNRNGIGRPFLDPIDKIGPNVFL